MVTLEVVVYIPHSLKVIGLLAGLAFTGGDFTQKNGCDEFRFEGDEETLSEAQRRLEQLGSAIGVRQETVED